MDKLEARLEPRLVVGQHRVLFTAPPEGMPRKTASTGPLLGNGDLGATLSGPPERQQFWLCKNDFWRLKSHTGQGYFTCAGHFDIAIPGLRGASYRVEQDLYTATTRADFTLDDGRGVGMTSYVAATSPLLVVILEAKGGGFDVELDLEPMEGGGSKSSCGEGRESLWMTRSFEDDVDIPTAVAAAVQMQGARRRRFRLEPGITVWLTLCMRSRFDSPDFLAEAKAMADKPNHDLRKSHLAWWAEFWSHGRVELGDPSLERRYYLSNYVLGSCSRPGAFPPSIFGPWATVEHPAWHADYHLNYNYQAPFYGLYGGDHLAQASSYHPPVLAFAPRGEWYAKHEFNCRGVCFPVGMAPLGVETTRHETYGGNTGPGLFMGQKSNAAYCVVNLAFHWYHSYDPAYGAEVYPFVRQVADFWEDYLVWDGQRYIVESDSIHELSGPDLNPILSLGLLRLVFALALDLGAELGLDAERHGKWRQILENLSDFPTQERDGKTVFRASERGLAWPDSNTLAIQHIYPSGALGLDSPPALLRVACDTIAAMGRWTDQNGMSSFYPAAVRVGFDPRRILDELSAMVAATGLPNGFVKDNPHGIENCSVVPNTLDEMLCMSHGHVLRLFPVWPRERDAAFAGLRAWGAFLVSAESRGGVVGEVGIRSERGRRCVVENPWPGREVVVVRDGVAAETVSGTRLVLATCAGEELRFAPR